MKIVAPLSSPEHFEPLVEAGAGEFYCGYVPPEWLRRFQQVQPVNRREYLLSTTNVCSLASLKIIRRMADVHAVPVKIALNAHTYSPGLAPLLKATVQSLIDAGFDTLIVADVALMVYLRSQGLPVKFHLSGEAEVMNHRAMEFMHGFHISRYVFPRGMTLQNMSACVRQAPPGCGEFEAFVLNSLCPFSGAFCNSIHTDDLAPLCRIPYREKPWRAGQAESSGDRLEAIAAFASRFLETQPGSESPVSRLPPVTVGSTGCGLCALHDLDRMGVSHVKVVGRGFRQETLVRDVSTLREALRIQEASSDAESYKRTMRRRVLKGACPDRCYYPEVR